MFFLLSLIELIELKDFSKNLFLLYFYFLENYIFNLFFIYFYFFNLFSISISYISLFKAKEGISDIAFALKDQAFAYANAK